MQRGFALHYLGEIAPTLSTGRPVLLETQCRIAFLQEALKLHGISHARVILVECDDKARDVRLHGRGSSSLANDDMRNWSRFLHEEARNAGYEILDTTLRPLNESVSHIVSYLRM